MEEERKPAVTGYPMAAAAAAAPIFAPPGAQTHGPSYSYQPHPSYYPAPPHFSDPYSGHSPSYDDSAARVFIRLLIITFMVSLLLFGFTTIILWLVFRLNLPMFAVSSASISSLNVSGSQHFSANFNLSISVRNPNTKMGIFYDEIVASVLYRSETLFETSLPPFFLERENSTVVTASFRYVDKYVDVTTHDGIVLSRSFNDGIVDFQAALIAWVRLRSGAGTTAKHLLRVFCDHVRIRLSNSTASEGALADPPQPCRAYL